MRQVAMGIGLVALLFAGSALSNGHSCGHSDEAAAMLREIGLLWEAYEDAVANTNEKKLIQGLATSAAVIACSTGNPGACSAAWAVVAIATSEYNTAVRAERAALRELQAAQRAFDDWARANC